MYKKIFPILAIFIIVTITACSETQNNAKDDDTLVVGTSADYPPMESYEGDDIVGLDIDIIKEIGERIDREVEIEDMSFSTIIENVKKGRIDVAISSIGPTPEREEQVAFSDMYHEHNQVFVTEKNFDGTIDEVDDITDYKVGVQSGSTEEGFVSKDLEGMPKDNVSVYEDADLGMEDLDTGRIDIFFTEKPVAAEYLKENENLKIQSFEFKINPDTGNNIAISKENEELLNEINEAIEEMHDDGTIEEIDDKWLEEESG